MSFSKAPRFRPVGFTTPGPGSYSVTLPPGGPRYSFGVKGKPKPVGRTHRLSCLTSKRKTDEPWKNSAVGKTDLPTISMLDFQIMEKEAYLGKGGVCHVFWALWKGKTVASKLLHHRNKFLPPGQEHRDREALKEEAMLLHRLQGCDAIVKVLAVVCEDFPSHAVEGMLLEALGDSLITRSRMSDFDVEELTQAFLATCHGIGFLHQRLVAHRDINYNNICKRMMIRFNNASTFKVIDFDAALQLGHRDEVTEKKPGSLAFASPEALQQRQYSPLASDCYAIGQTFAELATLWHGDSLDQLANVSGLAKVLMISNMLMGPAQSRPALDKPGSLRLFSQPDKIGRAHV